ncbi:hypothetical protein ACOME3_007046 [Neoechinorhynchus agilis]
MNSGRCLGVTVNIIIRLYRKLKGPSEARTQSHESDLIKNVYEGGFSVWECSVDLATYISNIDFCTKGDAIEVGCGLGLPGITLLTLHNDWLCDFQDFNKDVLTSATIYSVRENVGENKSRFFYGKWSPEFSNEINRKYDLILSAETIYETKSYAHLLAFFDSLLKSQGVILLASKYHYFGVGGSVPAFKEAAVNWNVQVVWESESNELKRVILKLMRK